MGYDAIGITMKLWEYRDVGGNLVNDSNCCSVGAINNAKLVCDRMKVPHYTLDFTDVFRETVIDNLENIKIPIDIVNIFRPSKETPILANQAVKIKTKVLWLQYGIQNEEAKKIATEANISYVENRCIKQEYQKIFQKMSPVFPALKL